MLIYRSNDLVPITNVNSMDSSTVDIYAIDTNAVDTKPNHTNDMNTDVVEADNGVKPNPDSPPYYDMDVAFISDRSAVVLPCTIWYMDLRVEAPHLCPICNVHSR